jgi:lycopene cyclase domain-containing protein
MNSLYLIIDLLTICFPLLLSFDKKVAYYKHWRFLLMGYLFISIPFVFWDLFFTDLGVWGFNPTYLTGFYLGNLPIEEVLFFIVVPFSCTFVFACMKAYFPNIQLTKFNRIFYIGLALYAVFVLIVGFGGWYSSAASIIALITIPFLMRAKINLTHLPISFLISMIPFFIVNGVLTGTGLDDPIVWYNDLENTGIRYLTIPMEDVVYGWTLIAMVIAVFQFYLEKSQKSPKM